MIETLISISPIFGTILFFTFFCYILYNSFKKGSKKKMDKYSNIPLNDEENIEKENSEQKNESKKQK